MCLLTFLQQRHFRTFLELTKVSVVQYRLRSLQCLWICTIVLSYKQNNKSEFLSSTRVVTKFIFFLSIWSWKEQKYFLNSDKNSYTWLCKRELLLVDVYIIFSMFTQCQILAVHSFLLFSPQRITYQFSYTSWIFYFILVLRETEGGNRVHRTIYNLCAGYWHSNIAVKYYDILVSRTSPHYWWKIRGSIKY